MAINYPQRYDDDFLNTIKTVIDHVNAHGKTIQDLVAEGQLTDAQYAELITVINGHLKSGEVDRSALNPDLRAEVDKIRNKIDKGSVSVYDINKNKGKFDATYFSSDFLTELNDGVINTTDVLPNSITSREIARKSINHNDVDFVQTGKNLFNKNGVVKGISISSSTGAEVTSEYHSLFLTKVIPGETYSQSHKCLIAEYDINDDLVAFTPQVQSPQGSRTITMTSETEYIKSAILNNFIDVYQMEIGNSSTSYEPFRVFLEGMDLYDFMTKENEDWVI